MDGIVKINYYGKEASAVKIKSDGTSDWERLNSYTTEWDKLSVEKIEEILYLSGAASLDKYGIPIRYKSSNILPDDVRHIIVTGVESELYAPSLNALLGGDELYHFVEGLKILNKIMPKARLHLAINRNQKGLIKRLFALISGYDWIEPILLEPKYPQEYDEIIVPTILGMKILFKDAPASIGAVVISIQTILHIYEAVVEGKPVIERIVALGGTGFKDNYHVKLRIGTNLEYLTKDRINTSKKVRIVLNSPLTGINISEPDFPIDRQCNSIIALIEETDREFLTFVRPGFRRNSYARTFLSSIPVFKKICDTNIHGEERPCVSCAFCEEVCPVNIIPHLLYKYIKSGVTVEELANFGISDCIGCNLCNYVCPSKIPIAQEVYSKH